MMVIAAFLFIGCCLYLTGLAVITVALSRIQTIVSAGKAPITVIVAARNEEKTIADCLESLMNQDYPPELFEVIVVDDRSDDATADVLARFKTIMPNLKIIGITSAPPGISPKKHALATAVREARGELILQTDADCIVPPQWASLMAECFTENVGMVAGISPYRAEPGALNSFIRHEYLWNAALAAGSLALGYGTHATGRNLGFRRDLFVKMGGYGSGERVLSGDDTLFLQLVRRETGYAIVSMTDPSAHILTNAPKTFPAFLRQRIRHMSTGRLFSPALIAAGGVIYGFHILLFVAMIGAPFSPALLKLFSVVFASKLIADAYAARQTKRILGLDVQWGRFVINEALLVAYMAVMPILGLFVPVRWKENS